MSNLFPRFLITADAELNNQTEVNNQTTSYNHWIKDQGMADLCLSGSEDENESTPKQHEKEESRDEPEPPTKKPRVSVQNSDILYIRTWGQLSVVNINQMFTCLLRV